MGMYINVMPEILQKQTEKEYSMTKGRLYGVNDMRKG